VARAPRPAAGASRAVTADGAAICFIAQGRTLLQGAAAFRKLLMTDIAFNAAIPVLRIYDIAKAKEFYVDFLGFSIDWEHRYAADLPLYMQVSRSGVKLHLSEHYGDGTPGSVVYISGTNIAAFAKQLNDKQARFARPGPTDNAPKLTDPFGNVLRFDDASNHE
jgi:catechol 2,3-dioxygenase-like lactoylglutathione lyase family enzyme